MLFCCFGFDSWQCMGCEHLGVGMLWRVQSLGFSEVFRCMFTLRVWLYDYVERLSGCFGWDLTCVALRGCGGHDGVFSCRKVCTRVEYSLMVSWKVLVLILWVGDTIVRIVSILIFWA